MYQGTRSGGTHNISFDIPNLPSGREYTVVEAIWVVGAQTGSATYSYHFKVLGTYINTRYHSPAETNCSGSQSSVTVYNNSCVTTPNATMKSGFLDRMLNLDYGTGSGHSINYGDVKQEFWCSPRPNPTVRRDQTITGSMGAVNDSTVAVCGQSEMHVANLQLYLHGLGVKTVTDTCPKCCGVNKIDNYSTSTSCWVGSLPDAKTIILY